MSITRAGLLGASIGFPVVVGLYWKEGRKLPRSSLSPSNTAFLIWGIVYAALVVTSVALAFYDWPYATAFTIFLALSLILCGMWLLTVTRFRLVSVACIVSAFLTASYAACLTQIRKEVPLSWAIAIGPGVLAGWLSVACVLGIRLAAPGDLSHIASLVLLTPSVMRVLAIGVITANPASALAILWTSFFSNSKTAPWLAAGGFVGLVGSFINLAYT